MDANATIQALVRLIDDPDELVYRQVRNELMKFGTEVLPVLEQSWEQDYYGLLFQDRIENLIHDIQFETVKSQLSAWLQSPDKDLLSGAIIIAKFQYPGLDEANLHNRIFFGMHKFRGDGQNYHTPSHSYVNTVLESRKGNPLSLCIIYSVIAQSLDLPIYGVNLPNHFVLAYMDSKYSSFGLQQEDNYGVLFYINAFAKGSIFDAAEIKAFIQGIHLQPDRSHFEPCSNSAILKRMLSNLIYAFQQVGTAQKVAELQELRSLIP